MSRFLRPAAVAFAFLALDGLLAPGACPQTLANADLTGQPTPAARPDAFGTTSQSILTIGRTPLQSRAPARRGRS